jgi:hypothetical protein
MWTRSGCLASPLFLLRGFCGRFTENPSHHSAARPDRSSEIQRPIRPEGILDGGRSFRSNFSQSPEIRGPGRSCLHSLTDDQPSLTPTCGGPPGHRLPFPSEPRCCRRLWRPTASTERFPTSSRRQHLITVPHYEGNAVPHWFPITGGPTRAGAGRAFHRANQTGTRLARTGRATTIRPFHSCWRR